MRPSNSDMGGTQKSLGSADLAMLLYVVKVFFQIH